MAGFTFAISLSVLNHLGRNLYRNFITVLAEAISNSWDADAKNVWIDIDRDSSTFSIKDDGAGMDVTDFQNKFLKIGYSKRANGEMRTPSKRPFIGAKGIGKLALLSCAKRVSIFSRKGTGKYIGGVIDNKGLSKAIKSDLSPDEYPLEELDFSAIQQLRRDHEQGTIIIFHETKEEIRNSIAHIKKLLAMTFRFSLIDQSFSIFVNGERVSITDLQELLDQTEFVWTINTHSDDYVSALRHLKHNNFPLATALDIHGFIGSATKPRYLKISGTEERATIDLFVNGRLREKNILRHIPTQRIVESYLYGQIHFDSMDGLGKDPFTSSREGIIAGDTNFGKLLEYLQHDAIPKIFDEWDSERLKRGDEGDEENQRKSKKQRKARDLYSLTRQDYQSDTSANNHDRVEDWLDKLRDDAEYNLAAYSDCFLSENLVREYIRKRKVSLGRDAKKEASRWREREKQKKGKANLSFKIRTSEEDTGYLGMDFLARVAEGNGDPTGHQSLRNDAVSYAPVRNVVGHTGLLTENGKKHLDLKYENIKARIRDLLFK